ncbi:MAG: Uma2 family endonuclease, partial [Cuspidothrix sp.]
LEPNEKGYLWSEQLGLYLGVHDGLLRYFTSQGELVPRPEETGAAANERAELEAQRAELEAQRAAAADKRAKRLAAKLRELNIDPDKI